MTRISPQEDVINGIAPLETDLAGLRPRLFFTPEIIEDLKGRIGRKPWSDFFARVRHQADLGYDSLHALVFLLTGERASFDRAVAGLDRLVAAERPTRFYHLSDTAFLLDWLYTDLDDGRRAAAIAFLDRHGRERYEQSALRRTYHSGTLTCNIAAEELAEIVTAGCAVYGEVPGVGPWLRYAMERAYVLTSALGPDGASQEGICYGGFYVESIVRVLELTRTLLGWDLYEPCAFLRNVPLFFQYSVLGRRHIAPPHAPGIPSRSVHIFFGDGVRYPWYGPDFFLRRLASVYRDPHAQWLADALDEAGASANGAGNFGNLIWHDPSVRAKSPAKLPTLHHFTDQDIVVMRSGWSGTESVFGFRCAPHAGHFALRRFRQCVGGGHMGADAGSFQLFAHGDWLITESGYAKKATATRNTVLVNGVGQTGEGGEWFECSELRRERRAPSIVHVDTRPRYDYVIGNVAPAYGPKAGLTRFLRHVLYVKPDVWVIADELQAAQPSTFELFFHACADEHGADRPFRPEGAGQWITGGERGQVRITALAPAGVRGVPEIQRVASQHGDHDICILRLFNEDPARSALFVTVLEAFPARRGPRVCAELSGRGRKLVLTLRDGRRRSRFTFAPGQRNPSAPAFLPAR